MAEERVQRRLAAILVADVVGYSRLMEADEEGTRVRLRSLHAELIDPLIAADGGRIVKTMGDGILVEFPSVVDAVRNSLAIQEAIRRRNADVREEIRIEFRIGVNIGDIIVEGDDIHGDGVNVASRLEGLCEPGEVYVSGAVYEQAAGKVQASFEDLGEQTVKNIYKPVRVYRARIAPAVDAGPKPQTTAIPILSPLPDKPSVAVLPFTNMSGDPEQEYFADGIVEDLTTALSRFAWLFVIARNTSFTYKGKNVQVKQVAKALGVRYVVEGSVRSSDKRLRVTVQLIDAEHDRHVWAENYDRPTGDLFDLQDEISQSITGVLVPALSSAERERSLRNNRPILGAWEVYQKGLEHYYRPYSVENHAAARRLFDQSIELDPNFADAHAMVALMGVYAISSGQSSYSSSPQDILAEAKQAAERAVQLEDSNAFAHVALGRANELMGNIRVGIAECETAVRLNPNLALAHHELGFILTHFGQLVEAIQCFDNAIRLSPNDPSRWNFYLLKGFALFGMDDFDQAIVNLQESSRLRPAAFWPYLFMSASFVGLGRIVEARTAIEETLARKPDCTVAMISKVLEHGASAHIKRFLGNLRQAGLPED